MPTGHPMFFRCAKCRKDHRRHNGGWRWTLTGRQRAAGSTTHSHGRGWNTFVEYRCLTCEHTGWSRNPDCVKNARRCEAVEE